MVGRNSHNLTRIYRDTEKSTADEQLPEWYETEDGFYGYWDYGDQPYYVAEEALWGLVSAVDHEGNVVYSCAGAGNIPDLGLLPFRAQGEVLREVVAERAAEIAADASYYRNRWGKHRDWVDEFHAYLFEGTFTCREG